jgi:hypothetical protein
VAPPSGLLDPAIARSYVTKVRALVERWPNLNAKQRLKALIDALNDALRRAQVPKVRGKFPREPLPAPRKAEFDSEKWQLRIDKAYLSLPRISEDEGMELGALVYHEGRHAEEYCIMVRTIASQFPAAQRTPDAIRGKLFIQPEATTWAARHLLPPGDARARLAQPWLAAVARGSAPEVKALAKAFAALETADKARSAVTVADAARSPEAELAQKRYDEARARYEAAREAYFCLPLEADAQRAYDLILRLWQERVP